VAITGGILLTLHVPNVSISGIPIGISIVVPFLNMTKQFAGNIGQVSHQVNAVVMVIAGTERIFSLLDQESEQDKGYVTLVNVREKSPKSQELADGRQSGEEETLFEETKERTGLCAWKNPHREAGTVTYTKLEGDVRLHKAHFGYEPAKTV